MMPFPTPPSGATGSTVQIDCYQCISHMLHPARLLQPGRSLSLPVAGSVHVSRPTSAVLGLPVLSWASLIDGGSMQSRACSSRACRCWTVAKLNVMVQDQPGHSGGGEGGPV